MTQQFHLGMDPRENSAHVYQKTGTKYTWQLYSYAHLSKYYIYFSHTVVYYTAIKRSKIGKTIPQFYHHSAGS